jgi:hypothetical protein
MSGWRGLDRAGIWHRVITNYHRDTDIFLLGLGRTW